MKLAYESQGSDGADTGETTLTRKYMRKDDGVYVVTRPVLSENKICAGA